MDDSDIYVLLEAPYNKKEPETQPKESNGTEEKSRKDKSHKSIRHRTRSRSRDKSRKRSRSKERKHRRKSRSRDRRRSRSRDRHARRRSKDKRSRSRSPVNLPKYGPLHLRHYRKSSNPAAKVPPASMETREERDARTVICMQLSKTIRARDLDEFFSSVGEVRDVRIVTCNKTQRFKGIAHIEFKDPESVTLAMGLNGQKLLGVPIVVQPTQAEKKRIAYSRDRDRSPYRYRHRSRSRDRHRSRSRDRHRSRSRDRHRSRSRDRHARRRSKDKRSRSRSPVNLSKYGPLHLRHYRKSSNPAAKVPPASMETREERDARTVFCTQFGKNIHVLDLYDFFSSVGKVRDVRMVTCSKTRRFKGMAFIEFKDPESVTLAMGLNGQKLLGVPIVVQPTHAEKNKTANSMHNIRQSGSHYGPMKLYIGSLHYNITEDMLRQIFEPFGLIESLQIMMDTEAGRSKGYGFLTYRYAEDAMKALEHLNGFEIAGRRMKVGHVDAYQPMCEKIAFEVDELDIAGYDLGPTGRLQLMYKLAEGTGFPIPQSATNALQVATGVTPAVPATPTVQVNPPIATQCFLLTNMFDPNKEDMDTTLENKIRDDVIEECNKHGGVLHVYVDKASPQGNVYVKCPTTETMLASVAALHGRWFGRRVITAAYVPVTNYHNLFPEAPSFTKLLVSSRT